MWAYAPLSGAGALKYCGRFNRPGINALYTSLDPTTAWMEAQQGFPFKPQPMTLVAYQVDYDNIADLNSTLSDSFKRHFRPSGV
jgi:RES domain-containing protein